MLAPRNRALRQLCHRSQEQREWLHESLGVRALTAAPRPPRAGIRIGVVIARTSTKGTTRTVTDWSLTGAIEGAVAELVAAGYKAWSVKRAVCRVAP